MILRTLSCVLLALAMASCESPYKKSDAADKKPLRNQAKDQAFQAFVGRLRIAVRKKDRQVLAQMMTPDFGYRWDDPPAGEVIFDYWEHHKLWGELGRVLQQEFTPNDLYMVAPPEVVNDPTYNGYRAGIRSVQGS